MANAPARWKEPVSAGEVRTLREALMRQKGHERDQREQKCKRRSRHRTQQTEAAMASELDTATYSDRDRPLVTIRASQQALETAGDACDRHRPLWARLGCGRLAWYEPSGSGCKLPEQSAG